MEAGVSLFAVIHRDRRRGRSSRGAMCGVVLEVTEYRSGDRRRRWAPATVLSTAVIANAPGLCTYALINAGNITCSLAFTYVWLPVDALVRGTLPGTIR